MTPFFFKRYLIAFDKYKWLSLVSFLMVMVASGVVAIKTKVSPTYVAKGTLTYNGSPVSTNNQIGQQEQILSKDILLSNDLIEDVEKKTQINQKQIRDNTDVYLPEKTETGERKTLVITVTYKDTNPHRAKKTLEAVMKRMRQQRLEHNNNAMQLRKNDINRELKKSETQLKQANGRLAKYDKKNNSGSIADDIVNLKKAIADNQTQQRQIEQKLSSINTQKKGVPYSQVFIADVFSENESITKLIEQINQNKLKLNEQESKLLPTHPNIINLKEQLTSDNKSLQSLAAQAVISLRQQLNGRHQDKENLHVQYNKAVDIQQWRSPLEQQVQQQEDHYKKLQEQLGELVRQETESASSWVAQEPFVDPEDGLFSRSIPVILGMGAVIGVLVGGGLIILLGSLESKFQTWEEIRDYLQKRQIQLLGVLPLLRSEADNQTLPVISLNSPYIEFYERCRIKLRSFGGTLKVVLLTSTVHFEGKTTTAYNLGVVSARAGKKTLIVETDLRSPCLSQSLGVTPPKNVVEPLRYYGNPNSCILPVPAIENLYILPSPGPMQQTTDILESNEIQQIMEFARSNFDSVILDTPALGFSNDALLLEPYSDGIVLVTRSQYTQKKLLAEAINQLTDLELRLLGVIINGVEIPLPYSEVAQYKETPSGKATKIEEVPPRTKYL